MNILIALIILAVLILVHEWGHFMAARKIGIPVYEFSLGFGTKLASTKKDGVEYTLRLIPMGGYVRMAGEEPGDMDNPDGYNHRKPIEKIGLAFGGPFMNFVLAVVIFIYIFTFIGLAQPVEQAVIGEMVPDKPAATSGLQSNDRVVSVNGKMVFTWEEFVNQISSQEVGTPLQVVVDRGGNNVSLTLRSVADPNSGKPIIGVYPQIKYQRQGIWQAIKLGFIQTYQMTVVLLKGLVMLFNGTASVSDLAGPIGITSMVGEAARGGIIYLLTFSAFLSINLGIINLLPIPALDGSRICFAIVEAIRRKPLEPEKEGLIHWGGFIFLMLLMLLATYNDLVRLFKG